MEKVKRTGIRLLLLFLVVINFSCGGKKTERILDSVATETVTVKIQFPPPAGEIFEYRSQELLEYELYAIWLFGDQPQFVINRGGKVRLLPLDKFQTTAEGDQKLKDTEFATIKFTGQQEVDGTVIYDQLELMNQEGLKIVFNHSQTKRALQIGSTYGYSNEKESGELKLSTDSYGYNFDAITVVGTDTCKLDGAMRFKGNLGYFESQLYGSEDEPYDARCKLVFFFMESKVEILPISSNADCGCGVNAALNQTFESN
jgi:hypothetical protein